VDFKSFPENMEDNDIYSSDYYFIEGDERTAQFNFRSAIFQPKDFISHLKPLHIKGHINGTPINHILVDNGESMNLMPYSLYKKMLSLDEKLIKSSMMISGVEKESLSDQGNCIYGSWLLGIKRWPLPHSLPRYEVVIILSSDVIGFMPINVYL
jgi:hypothetical protein